MATTSSTARSRNKSRLLTRQKQLLVLLNALGGRSSNLDFQKLLFLYCQEAGEQGIYEFVPYRFGAFSFTSYADRRKLISRGLLVEDEDYWELTDAGRALGDTQNSHAAAFVQCYRTLRGDALVAETYRRFPYYAIRSEIAGRVLADDDGTLSRIEAARPKPRAPVLSTIGYEGRTLENYLNTLLQAGVSLLCDVRRNPVSRKYGFSRSSLSSSCQSMSIRYEHLPELGIASENRHNLNTQADYDALFLEYENKSLPRQGKALDRIRSWLNAGERVAQTCYERLPEQCHRSCVARVLATKASRGVVPAHL